MSPPIGLHNARVEGGSTEGALGQKQGDSTPAARFGSAIEARRFRKPCRDAIASDSLHAKLYTNWDKKFERQTYTLKDRTPADTRAEILGDESDAWENLQLALPQSSRIEATTARIDATTERIESSVTDMALRIEVIEKQLNLLAGVMLRGELPKDATDDQVPKLVRLAKGTLTNIQDAAKKRRVDDKERKAEEKAQRKEERAARLQESAEKITQAAEEIKNAYPAARKER